MTEPRVAVWAADTAGCGHYRQFFPAWALQHEGADVRIDTRGPKIAWDVNWEGLPYPPAHAKILHLAERYPYDVVVMQRPSARFAAEIIPHLQRQGVRVVVDVDDLLDAIRRGHAGRANYQGRDPREHHRYVDEACRLADLVTVTTPALAERYGHGHGAVIPNMIPAYYLTIEADREAHTIGWAGTVATHPGDLQPTGGAVAAMLAANPGWKMRVVGDGKGVAEALGLRSQPKATGWLAFEEYIVAVGELDLGIVPLEDSPFNRAKSCLKAMEMASVGVVPVMSITPDNLRLNRLGVGVLAGSRGQWKRALCALARDDSQRAELAAAGRDAVAGLTYEANCGRWWDAWTSTTKAEAAA